jgi:hypothetical protein
MDFHVFFFLVHRYGCWVVFSAFLEYFNEYCSSTIHLPCAAPGDSVGRTLLICLPKSCRWHCGRAVMMCVGCNYSEHAQENTVDVGCCGPGQWSQPCRRRPGPPARPPGEGQCRPVFCRPGADVVAGPGRLWVQNDSFLQVRSVRPHPRGSTDCYKPGNGK